MRRCDICEDEVRRLRADLSTVLAERDEAREDRAMCLAENDRLILLNKELSDTALSASVRRVAEATADAHAELRAMAIREETAYNERDRMERERDEARYASAVAAEQRDTAEGRAERLQEELDEARQQNAEAACVKCGERPRYVTVANVTCDEEIRAAAESLAKELAALRSEATVEAILSALGAYRWPRWIGRTMHTDESVKLVRAALGIEVEP